MYRLPGWLGRASQVCAELLGWACEALMRWVYLASQLVLAWWWWHQFEVHGIL
jgi:hypothetical protein